MARLGTPGCLIEILISWNIEGLLFGQNHVKVTKISFLRKDSSFSLHKFIRTFKDKGNHIKKGKRGRGLGWDWDLRLYFLRGAVFE